MFLVDTERNMLFEEIVFPSWIMMSKLSKVGWIKSGRKGCSTKGL